MSSAEELGKMGLAGYGAGKSGEAAEALGRRRNGLERRGTSAESTEVMWLPGEGAAEYGSFWKPGKLDEIIKEDLLGISRAYEYQAMARIRRKAYAADRIEIREVQELLVSPEELASWERNQDFLRNGSRMESTREELIGQQRLMEYEALSRVDYEEVLALRRESEGGTGVLGTVSKTNPFDLQPTHSQTLSKNKMNALMDDIKMNGIQEPIKYVEYNGKMYVVDGHHRLLAAKKLGLTEVPIEKVDLPYAGYNCSGQAFL